MLLRVHVFSTQIQLEFIPRGRKRGGRKRGAENGASHLLRHATSVSQIAIYDDLCRPTPRVRTLLRAATVTERGGSKRKRGQPSIATRHKCLANCDLRRFVPPNSSRVDVVVIRDGDGAGWEHGRDNPSVFCGSDGASRSPSRVPRCSSVIEKNSNPLSQRQNP